MPIALGLVANIYNEANALPGWLETHAPYFDHISVYHAGPGGAWSNDGTMEILEKWRIPVHRGSIDEGFGICRTAAVRSSPCEWVMLLDADERFHPISQVMTCGGESTPPDQVNQILQQYDHRDVPFVLPNWENIGQLGAKLSVSFGEAYNQGAWLRQMLEENPTLDAVKTVRRHWHDFSRRRPTQNWHTDPDWQLRLMRNTDRIHYDANTRMHERLIGASNVFQPNFTHGPFFDHYHLFFKRMEPMQRKHDVAVYDAIHEGRKPPTWEEFEAKK